MPIKILMPALSPTMTEGNIAKWLKKEGDKVSAGDVIAEIETDKATMEVEAVDEGVLAKILIPEGTQGVAVNSLIAVLLEEDEKDSDIAGFVEMYANPDQVVDKPKEPDVMISKSESSSSKKIAGNDFHIDKTRIFASPLAKRIAAQEGISLVNIIGSGPHGRIIKADIASVGQNKGQIHRNQDDYRLVPNSNMRKIIAKRLLESKLTVPHFYLSIECMMDQLLLARAQINNSIGDDKTKKLSVNDFVILASAKALKDIPSANASWGDEAIKVYNNVDISVAVAIDGGLITPIIKNADQKDIIEISAEMKDLARRAKENALAPEEFQGGGFSISNLGMYGVKNFIAIVNPPQSSIMAVGSASKRAVVIDDEIEIRTMMDVTISCDHRVVDGAIGAQFLAAFKKYIESPILMFI